MKQTENLTTPFYQIILSDLMTPDYDFLSFICSIIDLIDSFWTSFIL